MQKTLGQKIKQLRRSKQMTQSELGKGLVTPSMISQIEADKASPSCKLLAELAARLGVNLQYFLDEMQIKMEQNGAVKYARMLMEAENYAAACNLLQKLLSEPLPHLPLTELQLDLAQCLQKSGQPEQALELYDQIIQTAFSEGDSQTAVRAFRGIGLLEHDRGNLVLAHFHWSKGAVIGCRELSPDSDLLADLLLLLAQVQNQLGAHSESLATLQKAQSILQAVGHPQQLAALAETFSSVYQNLGQYENAAEYARDSISIWQALNLRPRAAHMKTTLAQILDESGRPEQALELLEECLEQFHVDLMEEIAYVHSVIAGIFFRLGRLEAARSHCETALALADQDVEARLQAYRTLAKVYLQENQYAEAIDYCELLIDLCQKQHCLGELTRAFTFLSEIYKRQGNYMNAAETILRMQKAVETNLREITVMA
ncbi:tetratricopeptide repeat protein [Effusibacillus pohliae]|uniref:tetratricopeptide repeat protein n=1 Tax=Effusibacillus pohliae TaxID=232270 RepID=UPI0003608AAD|nr:tetratricopeptide repeat protein [Effusibacillus pohliae]